MFFRPFFFFRFCLRHRLPFITHVQFAYQRSFVSAWQQQQWLVSDGATDGSVVVFVNAQIQCVCFFVFQAVQWGARWPFGCCRGGITVTVWQSGPQPSCNGWALSRWTPLLPLFSLPHYLMCPLFHQDMQCVAFFFGLFSMLVCVNEEFLSFISLFLFFCFWRCFCESMKML